MRFGIVGTGTWARATHGAAISGRGDHELVGVWGRDPSRTAAAAAELGARAYDDVDALLADVDAVTFAVPPATQADLAVRAARAGRHLLLEKPIATTTQAAEALTAAVDAAGVASVVFFTSRFQPELRAWLSEVERDGPWVAGAARWLAAAFQPGSPALESRWRREKGGLWDVGPHALSMLWAALGAVEQVAAVAGSHDVTQLAFRHEGGATSTAALSLDVPPAAAQVGLSVWGDAGSREMPGATTLPTAAFSIALDELATAARSGRPHPCDVHLGRAVVEVLAAAEQQLATLG